MSWPDSWDAKSSKFIHDALREGLLGAHNREVGPNSGGVASDCDGIVCVLYDYVGSFPREAWIGEVRNYVQLSEVRAANQCICEMQSDFPMSRALRFIEGRPFIVPDI